MRALALTLAMLCVLVCGCSSQAEKAKAYEESRLKQIQSELPARAKVVADMGNGWWMIILNTGDKPRWYMYRTKGTSIMVEVVQD